MATKRVSARPMPGTSPSAVPPAPIRTGALLSLALVAGLKILVDRGRVSWPPTHLLNSLVTVAGCLALVGPPLLLAQRGRAEGGLGHLIWLVGGLLLWVFDLSALARGGWRDLTPATPLGPRAMGLTILAVAIAGWRWRPSPRDWSWTNVIGWLLGLFWIGMGLWSSVPDDLGIISRR